VPLPCRRHPLGGSGWFSFRRTEMAAFDSSQLRQFCHAFLFHPASATHLLFVVSNLPDGVLPQLSNPGCESQSTPLLCLF
jgi:hypothetical protein